MRIIRRPLVCLVVAASLFGASIALAAALDEVSRLFRAGRYDQARALSPAELSSGRQGEAVLWGLQLADKPREALRLATELAQDGHLPLAVRVRAALDAATVALAQDRPDAALEFLRPLIDDHRERVLIPSEVFLLAGTAARSLRMHAEARRYLELATAADPAYGAAQYQLGRIALDTGEFKRAAEAFEAASVAADGADLMADAGRWQALRRLGRAAEAQSVAQKVLRRAPSSLAAMEIRAALYREGEKAPEPMPPDLPVGEEAAPSAPELTVELARFGDRGAALIYVAQWQAVVQGLEVIDAEAGDYTVVAGRYVTREEAELAVEDLRNTSGLRGRVVEREGR
jgi:tetratricopeptide (TPR) repeat protein